MSYSDPVYLSQNSCSHPFHHQDLWKRFSNITRETISRILSVPVEDCWWLQAQLPLYKGGLGLRSSLDHAPAAYISLHPPPLSRYQGRLFRKQKYHACTIGASFIDIQPFQTPLEHPYSCVENRPGSFPIMNVM